MKRKTSVWIVGDQLNPRVSSLAELGPDRCTIFMAESYTRAAAQPFHKQKLAFVWAAMRHFAAELRGLGYEVDYYEAADSYAAALESHIKRYAPADFRLMETAEAGRSDQLAALVERRGIEAVITANNQFMSDKEDFRSWAKGRKQLRMENFYRRMRQQTGLLMDDGEPVGGEWNYDRFNRETPPPGTRFPKPPAIGDDEITNAVVAAVARDFPDHPGELEGSPWLPVTRAGAKRFARSFLDARLDLFGPYQDAIVKGERVLYHSLLSTLLNVSLLDPLELCRSAEARYRKGKARIESVEGFIRQILGWREFVYQVYHLEMPGYQAVNYFEAELPLPKFYWDADTDMACVSDAVGAVLERGHNHHIQRLMVTGNFALIAGLDPRQVNDWYRAVYTDAYDWVVMPNVLGMALFADGGVFASKPYAASANYIGKMSDCCAGCAYEPKETTGERACPFNALYWDFIDRNDKRMKNNPRMSLILKNWEKRPAPAKKEIRARAKDLRDRLGAGERF